MRVLLVTDTHLAAEAADAVSNWQSVRGFAAQAGADLTIHLGDITRDAWSAQNELAFAASIAAEWPTPLLFLPGNHDIGDNPPGPDVAYKQPLSLDHLGLYRGLFGPDYWTHEVTTEEQQWLFIGINAQLFATGTDEETAHWSWLESACDGARGRPVAIFSHKPLYQNAIDEEPPHIRYVPTAPRRRLASLLDRIDCRLFLSGHTHQFYDRVSGGTRHIWVPSSAYRFADEMQEKIGEKIVGVGLLELGGNKGPQGFRFDLVCPQGLTQFERTIEKH